MPSCCRAEAAERMFGERAARRALERYRRDGLDELERRMVATVSGDDLQGAHVLEIGGGIGAIQAELLEAGAERGHIVELVSSYEPYAYELARERGLEGRVSYVVSDLLDENTAVVPADVVVLSRVVCCSPDGVELAAAAARLARRAVLLSYPRDTFWVRGAVRLVNLGQWLLRRSFRAFVHAPSALQAAVGAQGFGVVETGRTGFWEFTTLRLAA